MKCIKCLTCAGLCLLVIVSTARAAESPALEEYAMALEEESLDLGGLERAAQNELDGVELTLGEDAQEGLEALLYTGTAEMQGVVKRAVHSGVLLLVIVLLCALGEGIIPEGGKIIFSPAALAGTLAVTAVTVSDVNSLMGLGQSAISSMTDFSNVLLPIVAAVTAATGAVTGAAARQMAAALFSGVLLNVIEKLLVPLVYGYIAASAAQTAVGNEGLRRAAALLKWAVVTILTVLMLVFVGYLTLTGVMSGSADAAAVKAAKFAISGAVPVVGGILADASESVLAAAGVLRGSVGVFGTLVILGVCLVPFLQLAVHYLIYKLCAALAATVDSGRVSALIDSLSSAFGLILGMTGACALLLLVAIYGSVTTVAV